MSDKPESMVERFKSRPLSFWGSLCIFTGIFVSLAMQMAIDAADMPRTEARASSLGSAVAGGLIVLLGIVLLVLHFVRRKPR